MGNLFILNAFYYANVALAHQAKKTKTISFRLYEDLINDLKREANARRVSVNTLVSQILTRYTEWGRHCSKFGFIPIATPFIKAMKDVDLANVASKEAKPIMKDMVLFIEGKYDKESLINVIEAWLGSTMPHKHEVINDRHEFTIQHSLGYAWSLYLKNILEELFYDAGEKVEFQVTPNALLFNCSI